MKIYESIYASLISPKSLFVNPLKVSHSIIIYILASISMAISLIYISGNKMGIFSMFIITVGVTGYMALSNILKISIVHTVASFTVGYKKNRNIKTFISNCFSMEAIFIFILPIVLLSKVLPGMTHFIFFISAVLFFLYYILLLYRVVKTSFNVNGTLGAIALFITPLICSYLNMAFFTLFVLGVLYNIVSVIL